MAMRVVKVKKNPKLMAEKASVQAVKARRKARQKPHSGAKMQMLKAKNKGKRRSKIPTIDALRRAQWGKRKKSGPK